MDDGFKVYHKIDAGKVATDSSGGGMRDFSKRAGRGRYCGESRCENVFDELVLCFSVPILSIRIYSYYPPPDRLRGTPP